MKLHYILKKSRFLPLSLCFAAGFMPVISHADSVLTKDSIERFYAQAAEVQVLSAGVTLEFLEEHLHEDASTTLHIITNMIGMPPHKQTVTYDKSGTIKRTKEGYDLGRVIRSENKVLSVDIAADGRSAKVKDSSFSVIEVAMPTMQGTLSVRSEQAMLCDGNIVLNADNIIQSKDSECSVEVHVVQAK